MTTRNSFNTNIFKSKEILSGVHRLQILKENFKRVMTSDHNKQYTYNLVPSFNDGKANDQSKD